MPENGIQAAGSDLAVELSQLSADLDALVEAAVAPASARGYASDWANFTAWCARHGRTALPASPDTVALYIAALKTGEVDERGPRRPGTIRRRLATIAMTHRREGHEDPTKGTRPASTWRSTRRELGTEPRHKTPILEEHVLAMVRILPPTLVGARDAALLLFGFASAMRRSELAAMTVDLLTFGRHRVVVRFLRSKTNQEGRDERVAIPRSSNPDICPVTALERWLAVAKIERGPVFRGICRGMVGGGISGHGIAKIVKRRAAQAGLGAAADFGAHSLRHGYATSRALAGDSMRVIRRRTRHKSDRMLERYIHDAEFVDVDG